MNEIVKTLKMSTSDTEAFLWQSNEENRQIFKIKNFDVNEGFKTFDVFIENDKKFNSKDSTLYTYAKFSHRDTVFKVRVISQIDDFITCEIPEEIRALELRTEYRHRFKPSDKKSLTLQINVELIMDATQDLKFQVIDISSNGASIVVSEGDIKYFEDGSRFDLTILGSSVLETSYEMEYVYSQKFKFKSHGRFMSAYRVGLKSKNTFDKDTLMNFLV